MKHPLNRTSHLEQPDSRRRSALILGLLGLGLFLNAPLARAAEAAVVDPGIEAICADLQAKGLLNGVVLVADGDTIIHRKAYGMANVEHAVPHTLDSRFMIASLTKSFTAALALQAVEQGQLVLTKPVGDYLEALRGTPAGELTIHELLSHSGGMTPFVKDQVEPYSSERFFTDLKAAKLAADGKGKFAYQNENYLLLAAVLEKIQGTDYGTLLQKQILEPVGMKHSGVNLGGKIVDGLVAGYVLRNGTFQSPPLNNLSQTLGAGSNYATAADLLLFLRAMTQARILKPESLELIRQSKAGPYSYGWFVRNSGGKRLLASFGKMPGYSALMAFDDAGLSVVVLNNIYDSPVTPLLQQLVAQRAAAASNTKESPTAPRGR